jgi:hypothetical protein
MERLLIALLLVLTLPGLLTFLPIRPRRSLDPGDGPTNSRARPTSLTQDGLDGDRDRQAER